jgi:hypothetical protein
MTVLELMEKVVPRLTGPPACDLFEAVREVQAIISGRLLMARSDMLREMLTVTFQAGTSSKRLDDDFQAVSERPYPVGLKPLNPLGSMEKSSLQTLGDPRYYEVIGKTFWIYPPSASEITIKIPSFMRPATLTTMTDELPFYGDFDSVFIEGCVAVLSAGLKVVGDAGFAAVIGSQVDQQLAARIRINEQAEADAINYGSYGG